MSRPLLLAFLLASGCSRKPAAEPVVIATLVYAVPSPLQLGANVRVEAAPIEPLLREQLAVLRSDAFWQRAIPTGELAREQVSFEIVKDAPLIRIDFHGGDEARARRSCRALLSRYLEERPWAPPTRENPELKVELEAAQQALMAEERAGKSSAESRRRYETAVARSSAESLGARMERGPQVRVVDDCVPALLLRRRYPNHSLTR